eukprot:1808128-Rhodomonas_salina.2
MLFPLKPTDPFKYLGCRTTLDLSWRAECTAVLAKTREAVNDTAVLIHCGNCCGATQDGRRNNEEVVVGAPGCDQTPQLRVPHTPASEPREGQMADDTRTCHCVGGVRVTHAAASSNQRQGQTTAEGGCSGGAASDGVQLSHGCVEGVRQRRPAGPDDSIHHPLIPVGCSADRPVPALERHLPDKSGRAAQHQTTTGRSRRQTTGRDEVQANNAVGES